MQDRGEKIVNLAREILRGDELPAMPEETTAHIKLSFKMLCLATVLTAVGSSAVTDLVVETRRPLNHYEKTELDALLFYAARQKNLDEGDLRRDVLGKLNLPNFDTMTEQDYSVARSYLQDRVD